MQRYRVTLAGGVFALCFSFAVTADVSSMPDAHAKPAQAAAPEPFCPPERPVRWRDAQKIDGVEIEEERVCLPDNPYDIAAFVKGTNNISMPTLMKTRLAADSVIKRNDRDGDGDPDEIIIKLEVAELNGASPDTTEPVHGFAIAPGIKPAFWVFAPKVRGMATKDAHSIEANPLLRPPSPTIRVEQGDTVRIVLENTHYFPHTIHLHGVDHPYVDAKGEGNDGVPQTSEGFIIPGQARTYDITPRQPGTFIYHCHVQTHTHLAMGLIGMLVVEENRPNNWVQTLNVGAGKVRHPAKAIREEYDQEYDLVYQAVDKELHQIVQSSNDPRVIAKRMNREYDLTDATEDYFLLNGRSFPYTLRESLLVVEPDQNIKLRMLNAQSELLAVHTHGHKATITHYDGVAVNPQARIMRDIFDLAPAQRVDLKLTTTDDGLHNYGQGIWVVHDHVERGITTDGMNPGGNISAIVYKSYLGPGDVPKVQGVDLSRYFTEAFYQRKLPVWQNIDEWDSLGDPEARSQETVQPPEAGEEASPWRRFWIGLLIGLLAYVLFSNRERARELFCRYVLEKS
ncbi:manganese oxidase [Methylomarinovum tepidoasis]|uniref:Manganese oxidase n=1 Tax=Methylomarinovum tepidoasis TaxID=2840183 RepID=A0AAU9CFS7_9GAMM|nr:multicopper oxidase domain-containing protein [Methylomarinovum sp. IN45]BCX88146.1 manganese oxidase [Methylomarinovum sp. IN45]